MFTNLNLTDMETCYKVFRREVIAAASSIEEDRFGFEPEITAKVAARRLARLRGRHLLHAAAPTPRARRSAGATACGPSTASSATRRSGARLHLKRLGPAVERATARRP